MPQPLTGSAICVADGLELRCRADLAGLAPQGDLIGRYDALLERRQLPLTPLELSEAGDGTQPPLGRPLPLLRPVGRAGLCRYRGFVLDKT